MLYGQLACIWNSQVDIIAPLDKEGWVEFDTLKIDQRCCQLIGWKTYSEELDRILSIHEFDNSASTRYPACTWKIDVLHGSKACNKLIDLANIN